MRIIKQLTSLCAAILFVTSLSAQDKVGMSPEERANKLTEKMDEKVALSDDQKKQVYEANLELISITREHREEMTTAKKQHEEKMKDILSEEQFAKYQKNKAERGKYIKDRRKLKQKPYRSEEGR